MRYKAAESYKADFQKVNRKWMAKVAALSAFAIGWFLYWVAR